MDDRQMIEALDGYLREAEGSTYPVEGGKVTKYFPATCIHVRLKGYAGVETLRRANQQSLQKVKRAIVDRVQSTMGNPLHAEDIKKIMFCDYIPVFILDRREVDPVIGRAVAVFMEIFRARNDVASVLRGM